MRLMTMRKMQVAYRWPADQCAVWNTGLGRHVRQEGQKERENPKKLLRFLEQVCELRSRGPLPRVCTRASRCLSGLTDVGALVPGS